MDGRRWWGCLVTNFIAEFAMTDLRISEVLPLYFARLAAALGGAIERAKREGDLTQSVRASKTTPFLVSTTQG